ncbi:hypothetical protein [Helicobacter sp. 11S02596-1]|uniref:hypothetical protein n=1 Tax=Helicobacter sp. 11S02596-1 TaxID=1476194 RepID=UPI000BA60DB6|nr:hypothetical protein [Helicobacter sp. 11S02596-1]PAF45137.1 hypothetical protein BJI48_00790 [Helicobacter sp. 11S02596-1]
MLQRLFLILAIALSIAQSIEIKDIQTFDRKGHLDLLLLSDGIFSSHPKILTIQNEKIIALKNLSISEKWQKKFSSSVLQSIEIFSKNDNLYIVPKSNKPFKIQASKSKDGYTLRFRFTPEESTSHINALLNKTPQIKSQPITLPQHNFLLDEDYPYWIVLGIMGFLIVVLVLVRKKFSSENPWRKNKLDQYTSLQILSTKTIDTHNKIILIQSQNYRYIVLLSNKQNLLIDKIDLDSQENKKTIIDDDFWASLKQKQNSINKKNAR